MKIGVAADLHFERGGDTGVIQYAKSFHEICVGMVERGINSAVFAGDIFNRWYSFNPRTFDVIMKELLFLKCNNVSVYMMAGNHDYDIAGLFPAIAPFSELNIPIITKPTIYPVDDTMLVFIPWITKGMAKNKGIDLKQTSELINEQIFNQIVLPTLNESNELKNNNTYKHSYMFFHASIFGADMGSSRCIEAVDFTLSPEMLKDYGFDLMVGGHFHRRQNFNGMIYVGSMERQNFGEKDNPTGWMLINGNNHEFIELESPLKYSEVSWDFTTDGDFDILMSKLNSGMNIHNTSMKLKYKIRRNDPFDRPRVLKSLYEAGATSVVLEPEYVEEAQSRTEIKAGQDFMTQFNLWRGANIEKDPDGEMLALLELERMAGFPDVTTKEHVAEMLKGGKS